MKTLSALGATAVLMAAPMLATPIDVITIEAILFAVIGAASTARTAAAAHTS
jgi:hypothetical protein